MVALPSLLEQTIRAHLAGAPPKPSGSRQRDLVSDDEYEFDPDAQRRAAAPSADQAPPPGTVHARGPPGIQLRDDRHLAWRNRAQFRDPGRNRREDRRLSQSDRACPGRRIAPLLRRFRDFDETPAAETRKIGGSTHVAGEPPGA